MPWPRSHHPTPPPTPATGWNGTWTSTRPPETTSSRLERATGSPQIWPRRSRQGGAAMSYLNVAEAETALVLLSVETSGVQRPDGRVGQVEAAGAVEGFFGGAGG